MPRAAGSTVPDESTPRIHLPEGPMTTDDTHRERMKSVQEAQRKRTAAARIQRGIVVVLTGDGKGKSTSAYGTALRALGHGHRVGLVQFIKGTWKTGEKAMFAQLDGIDHVVSGDGFTWNTQDRAKDIASVRRGWDAAVAMIEAAREEGRYQLIILDELNIALGHDYISAAEVAQVLAGKPEALNILVTGRGAPAELIAVADTVSEVVPVKHAFEAGIQAQKGVDF